MNAFSAKRSRAIFACVMLLGCPALLSAQETATAKNAAAAARTVEHATDVPNVWNPQQHLYIKGNPGAGGVQLANLEAWLDEHAPNWTILLAQHANGERYTDATGNAHSGQDAAEFAMSQGLSNRTTFGSLTDPRTGETNGAYLLIFMQERQFSYYASTAQNRRGLGGERWAGNLDGPAIDAMRNGGRVVDAVKNTITSIDGKLTRAIESEIKNAEQRKLAAEAERKQYAAALQLQQAQTEQALRGAAAALEQFEQEISKLRAEQPNLTGDLVRPDFAGMRLRLGQARLELEQDHPSAAIHKAAAINKAAAIDREIQAHKKALDEFFLAKNSFDELNRRQIELQNRRYSSAAAIELQQAAQAAKSAGEFLRTGNSSYRKELNHAAAQLNTAESLIRRRALAVQSAQTSAAATAAVALLLLLVSGWALNRRRRPALRECLTLLESWDKLLGEKNTALLELLERSNTLLGMSREELADRYRDETRSLGEQAIKDVDELFIMLSCAERVLSAAKLRAHPAGFLARGSNLFSAGRYRAAARLLRDEPVVFEPADGLERVMRGARIERNKLLGELAAHEPFTMPFADLIKEFNERARRALDQLGQIDRAVFGASAEFDQTQAILEKSFARAKDFTAAEQDGLLRTECIFEKLLPDALGLLNKARKTALYDPIGALRLQGAEARRQAEDALALGETLLRFRAEHLPAVTGAERALREAQLDTKWIAESLAQAGGRIAELAGQAANEPAAEAIAAYANNLEQFRLRVAAAVELNQQSCDQAQPSIAETEPLIDAARRELGAAFNLPPERILRESGLDPSAQLDHAREQLAALKAALNRGDISAAAGALQAAQQMTQEARTIVEQARAKFAEHAKLAADCADETARIKNSVPEHARLLAEIENKYASSVLLLGAGDPAHPNANGTIGDNLLETDAALNQADELLPAAREKFRTAQIFAAAVLLQRVQGCQETARHRLQELAEKHERLQQTTTDNQKLAGLLAARTAKLQADAQEHQTTAATREYFGKFRDILAATQAELGADRHDPFQAAAALGQIEQGLTLTGERIRSDRDAFAQAKSSVQAAEAQLNKARELSASAADDKIPDSAETTATCNAIAQLAEQLGMLILGFDKPHNDWRGLDAAADEIAAQAARQAAALRNELEQAENAVEAISKASRQIRLAAGWTGGYGVLIPGQPGADWLTNARGQLQRGDYSGANATAATALRMALQAIAAAELLVQQRRRAEEERLEQERRRRRDEEHHRHMHSSGWGGSSFGGGSHSGGSHFGGGGHSGFSSSSGAGRSGFSSGSGAGRSGW